MKNNSYVYKHVSKQVQALKSMGVYSAWRYNVFKDMRTDKFNKLGLIEMESKKKPLYQILYFSFLWDKTKEGYDFWLDIYNKCKKCK